jgi:hypothetical protein
LFESTETTRIREEKLVLGPKHELPQLIGERPRDDMESGALILRRGYDLAGLRATNPDPWCLKVEVFLLQRPDLAEAKPEEELCCQRHGCLEVALVPGAEEQRHRLLFTIVNRGDLRCEMSELEVLPE